MASCWSKELKYVCLTFWTIGSMPHKLTCCTKKWTRCSHKMVSWPKCCLLLVVLCRVFHWVTCWNFTRDPYANESHLRLHHRRNFPCWTPGSVGSRDSVATLVNPHFLWLVDGTSAQRYDCFHHKEKLKATNQQLAEDLKLCLGRRYCVCLLDKTHKLKYRETKATKAA